MTSIYAAATPVAANAMAPTRPPGREFSRVATATRAPASTTPAPTLVSGRRMPAWAARTSRSTTPTSVTATPATASTLPIQLESRGGVGRIGEGVAGGLTGATCAGQY